MSVGALNVKMVGLFKLHCAELFVRRVVQNYQRVIVSFRVGLNVVREHCLFMLLQCNGNR